MSQVLQVRLGERSYPIHIGEGALANPALYAPHVKGRRAAIVTSETVARLHVPAVEVAMLWLGALLRGELELPAAAEMERQIEAVRQWKRDNILFEPSRSCAINTRYHQYLDVMLADLGLSPYRKRWALAELVAPYTAGDYAGLFEEYERNRAAGGGPRRPLPLAT